MEKKSKYGFILDDVLFIIVVSVVMSFLYTFVLDLSFGIGGSMLPTMDKANIIFALKSTVINKYDRNDIVSFNMVKETVDKDGNREKQEILALKRIIGLPGEHVKIDGYDVYIDGEKIEQPYLDRTRRPDLGFKYSEMQLGEDEYFVMGDNRNNSYDSRNIGAVKKDDFVSKVFFYTNGHEKMCLWLMEKQNMIKNSLENLKEYFINLVY